ncbi:MAG TPA: DegV family protein [Micromonosporaceae bacterium]|nr:DegV family protein [Micromonosporaceae bacterium]
MARIAVVTDSTAYLPPELAAAHELTVVPLTVVIGGREGLEGIDITPTDVAAALVARRGTVTTSRPAPAEFETVYRALHDAGATGIVSIHLSSKLSGTCEAAMLAAANCKGPIEVIDGLSAGMGFGFGAIAAAEVAAAGGTIDAVCEAARVAIDNTSVLFYVDSLEYLRRGGRIGAASALLGTALSVKPILHVSDGAIVVRDKVRTASRAIARMVDLAVEAAGDADVDIAVHHLLAPERAAQIEAAVVGRLGDKVRLTYTSEIGAVVAAHVGPGLVSIVLHRH